jgi:hypothetical protein
LAAARAAALVTTDRVVQEVRRRIELGLKQPQLLAVVGALLRDITVVRVATLERLMAQGETALRDAAPSRNGSIRDAYVLVLAWSVEGDVCTTDRDFAGTTLVAWRDIQMLIGVTRRARE